MKLTASEAQELSALLVRCQGQLEMWADVVESRVNYRSEQLDDLIERVESYRKLRGWGPFPNFGGEGEYDDAM